ncbi:SusC/RagA family TonB-linked outer membrane protein [Hwangdonia sp.]|uniref:SusC/RagA family TonB-linked outer membrane protein n=1 Tax=Hwangdonia sp. TaxID=1883432 RepID=UPI003AB80436
MKNNYISKYGFLLCFTLCLVLAPLNHHAFAPDPVLRPLKAPLIAAQFEVRGTITDAQGVPLSGVHVKVKDSNHGVVSDFDGSYLVSASPNNTLVFSALGFIAQTIFINNQTQIDIQLQEDVTSLATVTINAGYYRVKDKERTGNIAKIKARTIEKQPVNNPLGTMQGHLSGVNIVQTTGVPGGGYHVEIRGKNFINGPTDPLYVVDGVPYGSQSLESNLVSSSINQGNVSPLNAINPTNIESIEVLKDADATAIYGARGANGVVLITTKKGGVGKTQFKAHINSSLGKVTRFVELMNTQQYLEVRREGIVNDGLGAFLENPALDFVWPELKTWDQNRYTDWQKELIGGTAYRNNVQLSVSGGSEQTQFLVSGGHQNETTVFPGNSNYSKTSGHSHINHQSEDNRFKIHTSTSYTSENNQLPLADFTSLANTLEPNAPALYDDAGNLNWENNTWDNPLASLKRKYNVKSHTLLANTVLSYKLPFNLEVKTNLGFNDYRLQSYITFPSSAFNPSKGFDSGISSLTTNNAHRQSWIIEPQVHWQKDWGSTKVRVLMGGTWQKEASNMLVQRGTGFSSNNLIMNLAAAKTLEALQDLDYRYNYQAFFGRINFNHKSRYILNLTGRHDGSSRFGPGKQFGQFGAVGAAWVFSNESMLKNNTVLSFGKIRGSYGVTGSDNIGDYKFLSTYNTTGFLYNGVSVLEPTGLFNPNFRWEENKKLEAALELGFFKDRILLNTVWYQNRSSNQLIGIPLPSTTGFESLTGNFDATVENTGLEIDVRTLNLKNKHLQWSTTLNITVPKNKLIEFPGLESSAFANRYRIGKPLTEVPLYHALGVDPDSGLYQFEDYNDDGSITRLDDRLWFEDLAPKFYGGMGNTLTYKQLSLDLFFQFKKQKGYNSLLSGATAGFKGNGPVQFHDRWQNPGDVSPIQRATFGRFPGADEAGQNQSNSNAAISDASYIRLRTLTLSYKVPNINDGIDLSIYLQGQNLWTVTSYDGADPEQPFNTILPPLKQITLGLELGF